MTLGTALQGSARVLTDHKEELGGDGAVSQGQGRLRGVLEGGAAADAHTKQRVPANRGVLARNADVFWLSDSSKQLSTTRTSLSLEGSKEAKGSNTFAAGVARRAWMNCVHAGEELGGGWGGLVTRGTNIM